jgi:hypothetical protein
MPNITRSHVLIAFTIVALTLLGYLHFPGHTYLQSDTQIYAPMLERLWDHTALTRDFMVRAAPPGVYGLRRDHCPAAAADRPGL